MTPGMALERVLRLILDLARIRTIVPSLEAISMRMERVRRENSPKSTQAGSYVL
jgi:hypothetical protein